MGLSHPSDGKKKHPTAESGQKRVQICTDGALKLHKGFGSMCEDSFALHYHGGGGRATMKLGTVLSDAKGKPEAEDAANIPWYALAEDQLLSDNDWWLRLKM